MGQLQIGEGILDQHLNMAYSFCSQSKHRISERLIPYALVELMCLFLKKWGSWILGKWWQHRWLHLSFLHRLERESETKANRPGKGDKTGQLSPEDEYPDYDIPTPGIHITPSQV